MKNREFFSAMPLARFEMQFSCFAVNVNTTSASIQRIDGKKTKTIAKYAKSAPKVMPAISFALNLRQKT